VTLLSLDPNAALPSCSSTQPLCIALAESGASEGTVVWCWEQTEGRGRGDRSWSSPRDCGLWISFLLRPTAPLEQWPAFTALVACAAAEAIEDLASPPRVASPLVQIKWPNDLYGRRGKLGGVLAQSVAGGLVFGLGINVWQRQADFPPAMRGRASSLLWEGLLGPARAAHEGTDPFVTSAPGAMIDGERSGVREISPPAAPEAREHRRETIARLASCFDPRLEAAYRRFQEGDRERLRQTLRARFYLRDAEVEIEDGRTVHRGRAIDLGPCGELILESAGARVQVRSGTVLRHGRASRR
jgi:biotin-(acetyl-CoA carboxylase) ligase